MILTSGGNIFKIQLLFDFLKQLKPKSEGIDILYKCKTFLFQLTCIIVRLEHTSDNTSDTSQRVTSHQGVSSTKTCNIEKKKKIWIGYQIQLSELYYFLNKTTLWQNRIVGQKVGNFFMLYSSLVYRFTIFPYFQSYQETCFYECFFSISQQ